MKFTDIQGDYTFDTQLLHTGTYVDSEFIRHPESMPVYMTTVFNFGDIDDLECNKGFDYNRCRNPNPTALNDLVSKLENGEDTLCTSSGMAAIATSLLTVLQKRDHILCDTTIYGENFDVFRNILGKSGIIRISVGCEDA